MRIPARQLIVIVFETIIYRCLTEWRENATALLAGGVADNLIILQFVIY